MKTNHFPGAANIYFGGTDYLGRDMFARVWEGTRISMFIAFLAAFLDLIIGVTFGGISAYYGGRFKRHVADYPDF